MLKDEERMKNKTFFYLLIISLFLTSCIFDTVGDNDDHVTESKEHLMIGMSVFQINSPF